MNSSSNLILQSLSTLFERDLAKLETEIRTYTSDSQLWMVKGSIANSAGNLCLHLCGNLQNYIGAILGNTGYQRNRPYEFSAKDVSKETLLKEITKTKYAVTNTLKSLSEETLYNEYPEQVLGYQMTTIFFLHHLLGHFNYHLGQINYHRRLVADNTVKD